MSVVVRKIINTSGFGTQEIEGFPVYGTFRNNWRKRTVTVHKHPTLGEKVVTVGVGADETFICTEARSAYAGRIDHNDWSAYN